MVNGIQSLQLRFVYDHAVYDNNDDDDDDEDDDDYDMMMMEVDGHGADDQWEVTFSPLAF